MHVVKSFIQLFITFGLYLAIEIKNYFIFALENRLFSDIERNMQVLTFCIGMHIDRCFIHLSTKFHYNRTIYSFRNQVLLNISQEKYKKEYKKLAIKLLTLVKTYFSVLSAY